MEGVGAALADHVDHRATRRAVFGGEVRGFDRDFFNGVHRRLRLLLRAEQARAAAAGLLDTARRVGDVDLVGGRVADGLGANELRELAGDLRNRARSEKAVVVLFSVTPGVDDEPAKVPFVVATTAGARDAGIGAGAIVKEAAGLVGGRGGGKPDLAQGAGSDPAGIDAAMARIAELVGNG